MATCDVKTVSTITAIREKERMGSVLFMAQDA